MGRRGCGRSLGGFRYECFWLLAIGCWREHVLHGCHPERMRRIPTRHTERSFAALRMTAAALRITCAALASLLIASGCRGADSSPEPVASPNLDIVQVDSGVFAAIRKEPLSLAVNSNSLIIVRDTDVVVVDAQFTRHATRETIAAIRRITSKPVSHVINTHWHDDHVAGNQVYQDSFPSVRFLMQENTAADLATLGVTNRKNQLEGAPSAADRFERLLKLDLGIDSTKAT